MALNIMHVDMDAFYAAVEQQDNPTLKGKPVIVGGLSNRGVVSTASYEARKYGVHSAMPIVEAKRLCPEGVFLPGRHDRYAEVSRQIFEIFYHYTPLVEKLSIDEAFLDLTGCSRLFGDPIQIGKKIKEELYNKLGLTASIGLARNKFLAKLASDLDKPDGFFILEEKDIDRILEPLDISKVWGVGKKTEELLKSKGIDTIGRLKSLSLDELEMLLGKNGIQLYYLSRGIDNRKVEVNNQVKSISHEETFAENRVDKNLILASLLRMSIKVSRRLRKAGLQGSTIEIKVRYGDFTTYNRSVSLAVGTNKTDIIYEKAIYLLEKNRLLGKPIRLLGVGVSNLSPEGAQQLSLFENNIKMDKLDKTIDLLRDRFGESSVMRARNLDDFKSR
ncbi:MAG TPA: DNA polymerase IV [Halanaerobiales bacterium]|nr:DNA polymerase IV [Halanaerobiales bacterium]HPZ62221.1 DNA polymerase IV [Halanaerobiales bacterium]HQD03623.1 DNA polymerase IV [Halanaerobiales bacterium]